MTIQLSAPLTRAFEHMKQILFKPFNLALWLGMGLSAFLARLADGEGGGRSWIKDHHDRAHLREVFEWPYEAWDWLTGHPGWAALIVMGVLVILGLAVLFTWLSSRGKFMFMHDVVTGTGEVTRPWNLYQHQGNALTVWRLVFGVTVAAVVGVMIFQIILASGAAYHSELFEGISWMTALGFGFLFLLVILAAGIISELLVAFVVPIMAKERIGVNAAWRKLFPLIQAKPGHFILYLLLVFVLHIAVAMAVVTLGLFTCCLGFLFLIIPYVSSVVLLPVSVTFRAFSLAFLAQFGPEFDLLSSPEPAPESL